MKNNDIFGKMNMDNTIDGNNNYINNDMNVDVNVTPMNMPNQQVESAPQEKVIHRTFIHEVPHVCPIHTRIINHHVYKHTYRPCYTTSEENVCSNIQCGSCCQFK